MRLHLVTYGKICIAKIFEVLLSGSAQVPEIKKIRKLILIFHRPPVAGIAGKPVDGAYSIVLAGGYEDDIDHGDEFTYTGAGGRDLSGNKRTAEQVKL